MPNDPSGLSLPGIPVEWRNRLVQSDNETDNIVINGTPPQSHAASHSLAGADTIQLNTLSSAGSDEQQVATSVAGNLITWQDPRPSASSIGQWRYQGVRSSPEDPGSGQFFVNNADHTQVTKGWISYENRDTQNLKGLISIAAGDTLIATQANSSKRSVYYTVQGLATDLGTYFEADIVYDQETTAFNGWNTANYDVTFIAGGVVATTFVLSGVPVATQDAASGFRVGSIAVDTSAGDAYICVDNTPGAAVWKKITP